MSFYSMSKYHLLGISFVCMSAACGTTPPTNPGTGGTNGVGGVPAATGGTTPGGSGGASSTGGQATTTGGATGSGGDASGTGGISATGGSGATGSGGSPASGGGGGDDERNAHFQDWPATADPAAVGDKLAKLFLAETPSDAKHYKVACAWYGSLAVTALLDDQATLDALIGEYSTYEGTWSGLLGGQGHVDENVFGIVPLEISLHDDDPVYLDEGLAIADHQVANIQTQKRFAIDDMFMITALQVQAYRASGEVEYLNLAASVMVEYLDALQQSDGMFFHHQDFHHKWARGNGWFAAGMAELIRELPEANPDYAAVRAGYDAMMSGLLEYQVADGAGAGLWKQIVDSDDSRNWAETSGSAMFTYALISGVKAGWLDPATYGPPARAAWLALTAKLNGEGKLQDISDWAYKPESHQGGPSYAGDEENYYFERPKLTGDNHGQAPMLWVAAELLRPLE